jgi:hypothetical protein
MTVIVRKPTINIREELSALKKPTGTFGEQLMRTQTADEFYNVISTNRNHIINGDFNIWQRGTSKTGNGYGADRWVNNVYTSGTFTSSRRTDVTQQSFITYMRCSQSVAGSTNDRQAIYQNIEGLRLVGKVVTVSFKAKASKTLNNCQVREIFVGSSVTAGYRYFNVDTSWKKYTFTGIAQQQGSDDYVRLNIDIGFNNDTWDFDIAEVQVEEGTAATPFEYRPYQQELALCQRYFWKTNPGNVNQSGCLNGVFRTSTVVVGFTQFPVTMRAAPTVTYGGNDHFYVSGYSGAAAYTAITPTFTVDMMWAEWQIAGGTTSMSASYNGQLSFSAEL